MSYGCVVYTGSGGRTLIDGLLTKEMTAPNQKFVTRICLSFNINIQCV